MTTVTVQQTVGILKQLEKEGFAFSLILIGLPGSGKSTFVAELSKNFQFFIASTDNMIEQVALANNTTYTDAFNNLVNMKQLKQAMLAEIELLSPTKANIINDQTNMGKKARAEKIKRMLAGNRKIIAIKFEVSEQELAHRLAHRERMTGKHIPPYVVTQMLSSYDTPTKAEGFNHIWELKQ